jgi:hypothetical protein
MRTPAALPVLCFASLLSAAPATQAHRGLDEASGTLVDVSVEVDQRTAPLYPARDGSGRFYVEARRGAAYAVQVKNRSGERLGVLLAVDGLNAISGEREATVLGARDARPGRMYVLDAWEDVTVRGWRTSLDEVRRFTFVDEQRSYAARSEQANRKMGWIEVRVYRERGVPVLRQPLTPDDFERGGAERDERSRDAAEAPAAAPPASKARPAPGLRAQGESAGSLGRSDGYPGTGWGARQDDPARVVRFEPERSPADSVTLRYEYRPALVRLGLLPAWRHDRDRLADRDQARGFARPPLR